MGLFDSIFGGSEPKQRLQLDPSLAPNFNLLGLGSFAFDSQRGLEPTDIQNTTPLFGGGSGFGDFASGEDAIRDLLQNPTPRTEGQLFAETALSDIAPAIQQGEAFFNEEITPLLRETIETGLPTDVGGIEQAAIRRLEREIAPALLERLSGDFGIDSTATRQSLVEAGRDVTSDLAEVAFEADELATGRRLEGARLAEALQSNRVQRLLSGILGAIQAGRGVQQDIEAERPGAGLLDFLQQATGQSRGGAEPVVIGEGPSPFETGVGLFSSGLDALFPG